MYRQKSDAQTSQKVSNSSENFSCGATFFQGIKTSSPVLDAIINRDLKALFEGLVAYERKKAEGYRIDGLIIGTGEADFTKGNSIYPLSYKGKRFQLIDVPGIEGDESKYAGMVREAVAKAHLVFYVNGTNKKPEKATAQKIRDYLRLGTQVCPLINVRGHADAYEFEEDRESLTNHGNCNTALQQTKEVLDEVLGDKVMQPGYCVQGLLAFSALAVDKKTGRTTIHPSRTKDLIAQQNNYQKYFESNQSMYEFSQISSVTQVLHGKIANFREEMIESNKSKVRELLVEKIEVLKKMHDDHKAFVDKTQPEFEKCREAIKNAQERFERLFMAGQKNILNKFFNSLKEEVNEIVENHIDDRNIIFSKINEEFENRQKFLKKDLDKQYAECIEDLQKDLRQAMKRLLEDVARVRLEQFFRNDDVSKINFKAPEMSWEFSWRDLGSIVLTVGKYAAAGAVIGTLVPVIGNLIGIIVGSLTGAAVQVVKHFFVKKGERIRKKQAEIQEKIDEAWGEIDNCLKKENENLLASFRKEIKESVLMHIQKIDASLRTPLDIINRQISIMIGIKNELERKSYGTV